MNAREWTGFDPQQASRISLSPPSGPVGADVILRLSGLPPGMTWEIGFGSFQEHQILAREQSDRDGNLTRTLQIPTFARRDEKHYFFVAIPDRPPLATSNAFYVTGPDGVLRIEGVIAEEVAGCSALRAGNGDLFTLVGTNVELAPGRRVLVEGSVAEFSVCGQGMTLEVRRITPR